jgi:hypothetical protein
MGLTPIEQAEYEANLALLQNQLEREAFDLAWAVGQTRSLAETIAWAAGGEAGGDSGSLLSNINSTFALT